MQNKLSKIISELASDVYVAPPEHVMTATETLLRQQVAEQRMHMLQNQMLDNINSTISSNIIPIEDLKK